MKFGQLQTTIRTLDEGFQIEAGKSVNRLMTMRNWLIGFYIVEFEQRGEERAAYGDKMLKNLAEALGKKRFSVSNLQLFRQFFLTYPQFKSLVGHLAYTPRIHQTVSVEFQVIENQAFEIHQALSGELDAREKVVLEIVQTVSAQSKSYELPPQKLVDNLSFSHFTLLLTLDTRLERAFYEVESIKGGWTFRELKRQINSMLFERTGLSTDKAEVVRRAHLKDEKPSTTDLLRSPYVFEFLGLPEAALYDESDLEKALLDHLQSFLLELGTGFCFEARQKRMLVDATWYKVDLVFYHRVLKCHVLIDLKSRDFEMGDAGQMNGYLNYFKDNEQRSDDAAPIGLLLCRGKNETAVRYALGGLDENIFVRQYKTLLPDVETLKAFLEHEEAILQLHK